MDLIINRADRTRTGLLADIGGRIVGGTGRLPRLIRNDGEPITIRVAEPAQDGAKDYEDIDLSTASVRVAVGLPDLSPTAGTFFLQVGDDVTAALPFDATAAAVAAALNLLPDVITQGGVTVEKSTAGTYRVEWVEAGTQGSIPATNLRSAVPCLYVLPNTVTGYTGGGATKLDGQVTVGTALGSFFLLAVAGVMSVWRLDAGTAATNAEDGIIRPADYDPATNAVNLVRVQGL